MEVTMLCFHKAVGIVVLLKCDLLYCCHQWHGERCCSMQ